MLAQILNDLYVPRDLLDQLPEDQKQILFSKMRQEQVRRYHKREQDEEEEEEEEEKPSRTIIKSVNKTKKQVTFRLGADGNEWCWVMGEPVATNGEQFNNKINKVKLNVDYQNVPKQLKTNGSIVHTFPVNNTAYYTVHRDERKQIEEISNNIQEARRIFERLESETRRLALSKENELIEKQQRLPFQVSQSDFVDDELFSRNNVERTKKTDNEKCEKIRDNVYHQSSQTNVCFNTEQCLLSNLSSATLNSSNCLSSIEEEAEIEIDEKETPAFPIFSSDNSKQTEIKQNSQSIVINSEQQTHLISTITRADIRQWFNTNEIPYSGFRSPNGQIYPWFHGIISRTFTEQILLSNPVGSYLIRVSEKIFGYVLSYRASDHCRHLLIEVTQPEHAYRFVGGARKELFQNLNQLIEKYSNTPIRSNSTDVLRYPCDQIDAERADYDDLFVENMENDISYESLYISLDTTTSSLQSTTHL